MQVESVYTVRATLGESPVWDPRAGILYWVDIVAGRVYAAEDVLLELDSPVGCIVMRQHGGLVLALRNSIVELHAGTGSLNQLAGVKEPEGNRFNDGKCDPSGRLLVGTMTSDGKEANGNLYSLEGVKIKRLLGGIRISNGLAWSPDFKTLYYIDTPRREVQAFDYNLPGGEIENGRIVIRVPEALGWPDGMTSDENGNLWIAMWGGAQVTQWEPGSGDLLDCIPVPAINTTSCTFGGKAGNELYITTARTGLTQDQLTEYPGSGAVFKIKTKVTGGPAFKFRPALAEK